MYATKARKCKVYSFEPSVFNLELLARNIFLNKLQDKITIIPVSLSDKLSENRFQMSSVDWGEHYQPLVQASINLAIALKKFLNIRQLEFQWMKQLGI